MTYLDISGYVGLCRGLSGFFEVCRGLLRFDEVCRGLSGFDEPGGYIMPCVCVHVCVWVCLSGFVGVCRAWGLHDACICNCKLYIVPSKYCSLSLKIFKNI